MSCFADSFPPVCDAYDFPKTVSESMLADTCTSITTNCQNPVAGSSESLVYAISSGNGTTLFRLNTNDSTDTVMSICTRRDLQDLYGTYLVSYTLCMGIVLLVSGTEKSFYVALTNTGVGIK